MTSPLTPTQNIPCIRVFCLRSRTAIRWLSDPAKVSVMGSRRHSQVLTSVSKYDDSSCLTACQRGSREARDDDQGRCCLDRVRVIRLLQLIVREKMSGSILYPRAGLRLLGLSLPMLWSWYVFCSSLPRSQHQGQSFLYSACIFRLFSVDFASTKQLPSIW